jgi:uncharacterized C2H2 Zn-finger protein
MPNLQSTSTATKVLNVPCPDCGKIFRDNRGVFGHRKFVHGFRKGTSKGVSEERVNVRETQVAPLEKDAPKTKVEKSYIEQTPEGTRIHIAYHPREFQKMVHKDVHRFKVIVAHRRFGKTTLAINEIIKHAIEIPGRYWYVAPTYRQAKTIAYDMLQSFLPVELIEKRNENELTFKLFNGSEIALKGAENRDSLRGVGLKGLILDEYGMMERSVWEAVLEPTLNDSQENKGWCIFIGTPNGRNHFYELFKKPPSDEYACFHFKADVTNILSKEFIEQARNKLPEETFRQEYLAEFLEGEGSVFRGIEAIAAPTDLCYEDPQWGKQYQLGVDLARLRDFTVITVVDQNLKVVRWERFQKLDWEYQKLKIIAIAEQYGHARVVIDATGVGDPIAQSLIAEGMNVLPFKMTHSSAKKELIDNLKLRIEQKQITIPKEKELLDELEAYQYQLTPSGVVKYEAPSGFHDDCVMSLALSVYDMVVRPERARQESHFGSYDDNF